MDLTDNQTELLKMARARALRDRRLNDALTVEELAKFLSVSLRTIRRMDADGRGPPRERRRYRYVYPVPELLRWLKTSANLSHEVGGDNARSFGADGIVGVG